MYGSIIESRGRLWRKTEIIRKVQKVNVQRVKAQEMNALF